MGASRSRPDLAANHQSRTAAPAAAQIRHADDAAHLAGQQWLAQTVIAGSPDAIIAMDSGRRLVAFNPAAEELTGYRRDDVLGEEMPRLLIPERERAAFLAYTERYLATGDRSGYAGRVRVPLLCADGTERHVELTATELTQDGQTYFCGFFRDLTEVEHAQTALAETQARFSLLAQLAPVGIVQTGADGRAVFVNDRWCAIAGVRPNEALGADWLNLVRPDDRDRIARDLATAATAGEMRADCRLRSSGGADIWVKVSAVALQAVCGDLSGFLATFTDISDVKQMESQREQLLEAELITRRSAELNQRQLEMQNQKLRELDEAKTVFLATVSHELRTPLTSIVSFSELIRAETQALTPDGVQFLDIIERNAHRLLRLVGDLLLLSKLESGAVPLELAPVSVPEVAGEAARAAAARAANHGITVHFSADEGPLIQADRARLAQVMDNLIVNAVKFSGVNGLIRVDAIWDGENDGGGWRIDVADTGIGIPPEEIGQLFGRFVRASNARTAGLPGTGLGLSIVKAITELHGGRVTVDSTLGHGTTFSVHLPAR
jgi:PAS domain S-box-containing protein